MNFSKSSQKPTLDSLKSLSNFEIDDMMKGINGYIGCRMRDELPSKLDGAKCGVINSDVSTGKGIHWTCFYNDGGDWIEYFDSYGLPPPVEAEKFLKSAGQKIVFNSSQLQAMGSSACGYFCVHYMKQRDKGVSPYDILYSFSQLPSFDNERALGVDGKGIGDFIKNFSVNNILNNAGLPEMHLPTVDDAGKPRISSFCGPFTKLGQRLGGFDPETGTYESVITPPVNRLDSGCLVHDLAYSKYKDVANRNIADADLSRVASTVINDPNARFIQKAGARLVKGIMDSKVEKKW